MIIKNVIEKTQSFWVSALTMSLATAVYIQLIW